MLSFFAGLAAALAPTIWTPPAISSDQFESHPAFDPRTGDLWFVRSRPDFSGWRIMVSRCGASGWETPAAPPFAGDGVEADPAFSRDGNTLWYISTRRVEGVERRNLDIWRVKRGGDGKWGRPERLPEPINSPQQEWFPRQARDGWLYFGSGRPGGHGGTDIWRAKLSKGSWRVENVGPSVNGPGDEYEPLISRDGKRMLIAAGDGYYESRKTRRGWSPRVKLGPEINADSGEVGALLSPSGRSWLFSRNVGGDKSGEILLVRSEGERWPPTCPR
jgi:hypothetical protein